jgi:hypothetical protein
MEPATFSVCPVRCLYSMSLDYELLSPLPDSYVHVRFSGPFQGDRVTWDLHLYTLAAYYAAHPREEHSGEISSASQQFMNIETGRAVDPVITVALAVSVIDEPTVRKCVIMIRNYKRLHPGWHAWSG